MLQNISKSTKNLLPVMEMFPTIQGEGFHQGKPAFFVRLGGCDVGCHWCDVKDSWPFDHPQLSVNQIVSEAKKYSARLVVITGGEPLMHNLDQLTKAFKADGFETNMETSGAHPLSGTWDWITLSPKKFKKPLPEIFSKASELKIIIFNKSDFEWAEKMAQNVSDNCKLYLQPEWSKSKENMESIVNYALKNPNWYISLQIHKFMNIP